MDDRYYKIEDDYPFNDTSTLISEDVVFDMLSNPDIVRNEDFINLAKSVDLSGEDIYTAAKNRLQYVIGKRFDCDNIHPIVTLSDINHQEHTIVDCIDVVTMIPNIQNVHDMLNINADIGEYMLYTNTDHLFRDDHRDDPSFNSFAGRKNYVSQDIMDWITKYDKINIFDKLYRDNKLNYYFLDSAARHNNKKMFDIMITDKVYDDASLVETLLYGVSTGGDLNMLDIVYNIIIEDKPREEFNLLLKYNHPSSTQMVIQAAKNGHLSMIKKMISMDIFNKDQINKSMQDNVLTFSILSGNADLVIFIMDLFEMNIASFGYLKQLLVLERSIRSGSISMLEFSVSKQLPRPDDRGLMLEAYKSGNVEMIKELQYKYNIPLYTLVDKEIWGIIEYEPEVIEYLIDNGLVVITSDIIETIMKMTAHPRIIDTKKISYFINELGGNAQYLVV